MGTDGNKIRAKIRSIIRWSSIIIFCAPVLVSSCASVSLASSDLNQIGQNLRQLIFDEIPVKDRATWNMDGFKMFLSHLRDDGSYDDDDYNDWHAAQWGPLDTVARAVLFGIAVRLPGHPYYQDPKIEAIALKSIHFVATHSFHPHYNWWHREIGFPLYTYKALLLFDDLPAGDRDFLMHITRQGHVVDHPSGWRVTGQNAIWFSEITLALGYLYQNESWVQIAVKTVENELRLGNAEGIQPDQTFYQHGNVFYTGGYGLDFAKDVSRLFRVVGGTRYAFSAENYETLSRYILDGQLWLTEGKTTDFSSKGRYYARAGSGSHAVVLEACLNLSLFPGPHQDEFKKCADYLARNQGRFRIGNKSFYRADFMIENQPGFGISVKAFSKRVYNTDASPMGEGLRSHFLSDGLTYIHRDGSEYWNIYPVWNYDFLPGTTQAAFDAYPIPRDSGDDPRALGPTAFVGGVSDGETGAMAYDFKRGGLSGRKAYFFNQKGMVALGAVIQCKHCGNVHTTLNQDWASDALAPSVGSGWAEVNGIGYLALDGTIQTKTATQTGTWNALYPQLSSDPVSGEVSTLWIDHGQNPTDGRYAYAVYPGVSIAALQALSQKPDFNVLSNTRDVQAVYFPEQGLVQAMFYSAGKVSWKDGRSVSVDRPCAVQLKVGQGPSAITGVVADPAQIQSQVQVCVSGLECKTISLPRGLNAGASVGF